MSKLVAIRFTASVAGYAGGEIAGFEETIARRYVELGRAEFYRPEAEATKRQADRIKDSTDSSASPQAEAKKDVQPVKSAPGTAKGQNDPKRPGAPKTTKRR